MKAKRARSGGVRHPGRNAVISGVVTGVSLVLVVLGMADIRGTSRSGSPLLMLGLFPALLGADFPHSLPEDDPRVWRPTERT